MQKQQPCSESAILTEVCRSSSRPRAARARARACSSLGPPDTLALHGLAGAAAARPCPCRPRRARDALSRRSRHPVGHPRPHGALRATRLPAGGSATSPSKLLNYRAMRSYLGCSGSAPRPRCDRGASHRRGSHHVRHLRPHGARRAGRRPPVRLRHRCCARDCNLGCRAPAWRWPAAVGRRIGPGVCYTL